MLLASMAPAAAQTQKERLQQHVYTLAADSLQGREAGTDGGYRAAQYIVRQYKAMGLKPLYEDYFQYFYDDKYRNVVGFVEGSDPVLKQEYIIVGAHYDHLGVRNDTVVYNGADDNASGTAVVIELARRLLARQGELKRSVVLVNFDAEEAGLIGSYSLSGKLGTKNEAENAASKLGFLEVPLTNAKLMMSLDMVGWLKAGHTLRFSGTGMLQDCEETLRQVADAHGLAIKTKAFDNYLFGSTDSEPFAKRRVPALYVTTGLKSPYHKPGDDADLIDYDGLDSITDYMVDAVTAFANSPELESTGRVALKHQERHRTVEAGLLIGYGNSCLVFDEGGFNGMRQIGWHGGVAVRLNYKSLALQVEGLYDHSRSLFPSWYDPYGQAESFMQSSITVPFSVQLQTQQPMFGASVGVGGFYGRVLNTELADGKYPWEANPNQWGFQFNVSLRLGRFIVMLQDLYQRNGQFSDLSSATGSDMPVGLTVAPKARLNRVNASVIFLF